MNSDSLRLVTVPLPSAATSTPDAVTEWDLATTSTNSSNALTGFVPIYFKAFKSGNVYNFNYAIDSVVATNTLAGIVSFLSVVTDASLLALFSAVAPPFKSTVAVTFAASPSPTSTNYIPGVLTLYWDGTTLSVEAYYDPNATSAGTIISILGTDGDGGVPNTFVPPMAV